MLKRMGRHWYTARSYAAAVERLSARLPAFGLGADVMVGFPGETDADFAATVALIEALPFTYLHVFAWSPRPGTAALRLPDAPPPPVAAQRSAQVREHAAAKARDYERRRAGAWADVVVINGGRGRIVLTEDYLTVPMLALSRPPGTRSRAFLRLDSQRLVAALPATDATPVESANLPR
jgi:threonylcarbamoyladenosine tRNA methylthiotransferase MtaB